MQFRIPPRESKLPSRSASYAVQTAVRPTRSPSGKVQRLKRLEVGLGQVDASVPLSQWKEVDAQPKTIRPADVLDVNAKPLAADAVVRIGERVTFVPSTVTGFEAAFTRNHSAYDVSLDGKLVRGDAALKAIYEALRETHSKGKG